MGKKYKKKQSENLPSLEPLVATPKTNTAKPKKQGGAFYKQFILLLGSVFLLMIFMSLKKNDDWFNSHILEYWDEYQDQKTNLDIETRMQMRFGDNYVISKTIADVAKKNKFDKETILIPASSYFEAQGLPYKVPEPAVFYYFTSQKTAWMNSTDTATAKWLVFSQNKRLLFFKIENKQSRDSILQYYRKYKPSL